MVGDEVIAGPRDENGEGRGVVTGVGSLMMVGGWQVAETAQEPDDLVADLPGQIGDVLVGR